MCVCGFYNHLFSHAVSSPFKLTDSDKTQITYNMAFICCLRANPRTNKWWTMQKGMKWKPRAGVAFRAQNGPTKTIYLSTCARQRSLNTIRTMCEQLLAFMHWFHLYRWIWHTQCMLSLGSLGRSSFYFIHVYTLIWRIFQSHVRAGVFYAPCVTYNARRRLLLSV